MNQRGRKSAASNVVCIDVAQQKPIDPPKYLTAEQKKIWQDIVGAMKPGQFPTAVHPLLETYCMCISRIRAIEQQLREVNPTTDFKRYRMLTTMQVRESALLCSLSTRLRLLKPSSSRQDRHEKQYVKPWELHLSKPGEDDEEDKP
jgi:phage terminase small subunit